LAGIKAFYYAKPFQANLRFGKEEVNNRFWMIALANGCTEGGYFNISPYSSNTDGQIDLVLFPDNGRLNLILVFIKLSFGLELKSKYRKIISVREVDIILNTPQLIHLDGENKSFINHIKMRVGNQFIKIIAPN